MGKKSRDKGNRFEREIVNWHKERGIHSVKSPLSGAVQFRGETSDVDIHIHGPDKAPVIAECKIRASGFKQVYDFLGSNDALFIRQDHAEALVILPMRTWERLLRVIEL